MAFEKTKNPYSLDPADSKAEKNLFDANQVGSVWGVGTPASSKEDGAFQAMFLAYMREVVRSIGESGWYELGGYNFSGAYPANTFRMDLSRLMIGGLPITVAGVALASDTENVITLNSPPGSGSHNDLVFLEAWLAEVPGSTVSLPSTVNKPSTTTLYKYGNRQYGGTNIADDINEADFEIRRRVQVQYRVRVVSDVDFSTYPNGVDDPDVKAQGGAASPTAIQFAVDPRDANLYVGGNGSVAHQGSLVSLNGLVYALPIAKVARTTGVTEITSPDLTDLRTTNGVANFVRRAGDQMTGDLSLVSAGSRIFLIQSTANSSTATIRAKGKTAGGVEVVGELIADPSGVVRLKAFSNHPLEFWTNNTRRALITNGGVLQTDAGKVYRHDGNTPRYESSPTSIPANSSTGTFAHGLGVVPKHIQVVINNATTDLGYASGQQALVVNGAGHNGSTTISADATNVYITRGSEAIHLMSKSTFASAAITTGNWNMIVRADP